MNRLALLFLTVFGTPLLAQSADSSAVKEGRYAFITLTKYCHALETFSNTRKPRIFAQSSSGVGPSSGWMEFSSRDAWRRAGKPQPLALVWYKDDRVARVAITARDGSGDGRSYVEYCYRPDGSLARLRSMPKMQTDCDQSLFHCSFTFREERFYPPKAELVKPSRKPVGGRPPVLAEPIDVLRVYGVDLRPFKSERTSISCAPIDWPEYLSVWELPFNRLLYASTK